MLELHLLEARSPSASLRAEGAKAARSSLSWTSAGIAPRLLRPLPDRSRGQLPDLQSRSLPCSERERRVSLLSEPTWRAPPQSSAGPGSTEPRAQEPGSRMLEHTHRSYRPKQRIASRTEPSEDQLTIGRSHPRTEAEKGSS